MKPEELIELASTIGQITWQMKKLINQSFKAAAVDLTDAQYCILEALAMQDSCPQQTLANGLHKTKANITHLIDQLVKKGMVQKVMHPTDRRSNLISLTPLGRQTHQQLLVLITEVFNQRLGQDFQKEYGAFLQTARQLLQRIQ